MKYKQFLGIILGGLYGIGFRLICGIEALYDGLYDYYNIYSIYFKQDQTSYSSNQSSIVNV